MNHFYTILIVATFLNVSCKKENLFSSNPNSRVNATDQMANDCKLLAQSKNSFYSCDGKTFDASGSEFIHRGVNMPLAYFKPESKADIAKVVKAGFNSVRVLWCADTLHAGGRCDSKDMHNVAELDRYLTKLKSQNLVSVLNLQNATGRDDESSLAKIVDYLTRDEIKTVLNKHKRNLQINIANEWHGTWANRAEGGKKWYRAYKEQLSRLRAAGLEHQFIIDTCGWGQDPSCIYNYGEQLLEVDPNIAFSVHVYDSLGKNKDNLTKMYAFIREKKLPFIVGEFASTHYGKNVEWQTVIDESTKKDSQYGFIAWSWSGNSSSLESLDIISRSEFGRDSDLESSTIRGLTGFGKSLLEYKGGLKSYSQPACSLVDSDTCNNVIVVNSTEIDLNEAKKVGNSMSPEIQEPAEDFDDLESAKLDSVAHYYPKCHSAKRLGYLTGRGKWGWVHTRKGFSCKRDKNVKDDYDTYPICDSEATDKRGNSLHSMNGEWGYINGYGFSCVY